MIASLSLNRYIQFLSLVSSPISMVDDVLSSDHDVPPVFFGHILITKQELRNKLELMVLKNHFQCRVSKSTTQSFDANALQRAINREFQQLGMTFFSKLPTQIQVTLVKLRSYRMDIDKQQLDSSDKLSKISSKMPIRCTHRGISYDIQTAYRFHRLQFETWGSKKKR